jgi:hypothetical protein
MKVRSALAALVAVAALAAVGVPAAAASSTQGASPQVTNVAPLYTMPISGVAKNGKKFTGSYGIQRFVVKDGKVWADGTVKGRLNGRRVTRGNVMMPASLTDASNTAQTSQAATCQILHLVLGPITLNLLGLHVTLGGGTAANQPIVLDLTAQQGGGLLGDLLCGLDNALGGQLGQLTGQLQQLASTLNSIISLLGGLQATTP